MDFVVNLTEDVSEFIISLPIKMQAKIHRTIQLLETFGYTLPEPHSKKIKATKNLYELRVKQSNNICRLFYFHWKDKIYIITSGYIKKSDKINKNQIENALKIMKIFMEENNE